MKMKNPGKYILKAATLLLQESCPDLTPTALVDAIRNYKGRDMPLCLTVEEAAAWLRIDKRSIQNYIQQGKIKVIRFGQTVRIPESSLIPVDEVENASDVGDGQ